MRAWPSGEAVFDPDEQVQAVARLVFAKFAEIGTVQGVMRYLVEQGIEMGIRMRSGPLKGEVVWKRPARATITCMLHSPVYAGIYAYGRRRVDPMRQRPGHPGSGLRGQPRTSGSPASKGRCRLTSASSSTGRTWPGSPPTTPAPTRPERSATARRCWPACCAAAAG